MHRRILLALCVLLAGSYAVRVALARQGGQYFWLDESQRFSPCVRVVDAIRYHGPDWREVGDVFAINQHHIGFFLVGIPVAALYEFIGSLAHVSDLWIIAAILSLSSVACIALVYAIARRSGASPEEALGAAFLMACANSMFYSTRHILPYESGLAANLGVLWLALGNSRSLLRSYMLGALACVAYLIYYGYLSTALVVLALYVLPEFRLRTAGAVLVGFLSPLLLLEAFTRVWMMVSPIPGANPFLVGLSRLMGGADQGDFAEGWRVPWAVLWHVEHGLVLVWVGGLVGACWLLVRGEVARRHVLWLTALGFLYGQIVLESSVLHLAVVEGRFARQLVPFLCLLTAATVAQVTQRWRPVPRMAWAVVFAACVGQAALNFAVPFRLHFPNDVQAEIVKQYGAQVSFGVSVVGPGGWEERGTPRYLLLNTATFLYPATANVPSPPGRVLVRYAHPLTFLPYQYEVYDPASRAVLQSTDISMRLIDTEDRDAPSQ